MKTLKCYILVALVFLIPSSLAADKILNNVNCQQEIILQVAPNSSGPFFRFISDIVSVIPQFLSDATLVLPMGARGGGEAFNNITEQLKDKGYLSGAVFARAASMALDSTGLVIDVNTYVILAKLLKKSPEKIRELSVEAYKDFRFFLSRPYDEKKIYLKNAPAEMTNILIKKADDILKYIDKNPVDAGAMVLLSSLTFIAGANAAPIHNQVKKAVHKTIKRTVRESTRRFVDLMKYHRQRVRKKARNVITCSKKITHGTLDIPEIDPLLLDKFIVGNHDYEKTFTTNLFGERFRGNPSEIPLTRILGELNGVNFNDMSLKQKRIFKSAIKRLNKTEKARGRAFLEAAGLDERSIKHYERLEGISDLLSIDTREDMGSNLLASKFMKNKRNHIWFKEMSDEEFNYYYNIVKEVEALGADTL